MVKINEGRLAFSFPDTCEAGKYDDWSFFRNQFQAIAGGAKAVDFVCLANGAAWLVEVKDYRQHSRTKALDLCDEVARKARDTLAGLAAAAANANSADEKRLARKALGMQRWRVVLHLEQPRIKTRLHPRINPASVLQKLKSKGAVRAIDAHPIVSDGANLPAWVPWTVRSK